VFSAQPSILTEATFLLDDYFKTNPGGVKDVPVVFAMKTQCWNIK